MSNRFTVDFVSKQIICTKTSLNKAKHYGTPEYKELCELMEAHPRFRVITKKVKKSTSKHTYKDLNYEFIENYISIQSRSEEIKKEYEKIRKFAHDYNLGVYPYTKSWFLKKFGTEAEPFNMKKAREELKSAGFAVAVAEIETGAVA